MSQRAASSEPRGSDPRAHLLPIEGGPWLDDPSHRRGCRRLMVCGGLLVLVSLLVGQHPQAFVGFWVLTFCLGLMLAVFGGPRVYSKLCNWLSLTTTKGEQDDQCQC